MSTSTTEFPHTFAVDGPLDVTVELGSGSVNLTAADTAEASVTLRPSRPDDSDVLDLIARSRVELSGNALLIHVPRRRTIGFSWGRDVIVEATVPTGSDADVKTGSADVRMEGTFGDANVSAGSGDIWIASCGDAEIGSGSGDIRLGNVLAASVKTGSGDVAIESSSGTVQAGTGSGDVRLGQLGGDANVKTGSGDIEVATLPGGAADASAFGLVAKTASGDVIVRRAEAGELELRTASGRISVGVPDGTAALLDCSSVTGRCRSGLTPSPSPDEDEGRRLRVTARSVSGNVDITRSR